MDLVIRIITCAISLLSLGIAVFTFIGLQKTKRLMVKNPKLGLYIKHKNFLLMKNDGENLFDDITKFTMPKFSQESDYVIRNYL